MAVVETWESTAARSHARSLALQYSLAGHDLVCRRERVARQRARIQSALEAAVKAGRLRLGPAVGYRVVAMAIMPKLAFGL